MSHPASRHLELMGTPADRIFAALVDLYGRRVADDVAAKLLDRHYKPVVVWPQF